MLRRISNKQERILVIGLLGLLAVLRELLTLGHRILATVFIRKFLMVKRPLKKRVKRLVTGRLSLRANLKVQSSVFENGHQISVVMLILKSKMAND